MAIKIDNEIMGKFIKKRRAELKLTQKELGEKVNVTDKAVSKWERGLSFPDITLLPELSKSLEISVSELISGELIGENVSISLEKIDEVVDKSMNYTKNKYKNSTKKIAFTIMSLVLALASIICFAVNLSVNGRLTWSIIPIMAMVIVVIIVASVLFTSKNKIEVTLVTSFVSISAFLYMLETFFSNNKWFFSIGLPSLILGLIYLYINTKSYFKLRHNMYLHTALNFVMIGVISTIINTLVYFSNITSQSLFSIVFSIVFTLPPCILVAIILYIIGIKQNKHPNAN